MDTVVNTTETEGGSRINVTYTFVRESVLFFRILRTLNRWNPVNPD